MRARRVETTADDDAAAERWDERKGRGVNARDEPVGKEEYEVDDDVGYPDVI